MGVMTTREYTEACCFNYLRDHCVGVANGCPCGCHTAETGRDLDLEVARAMGENTRVGEQGQWLLVGVNGELRALPRYSTDIKAAWTIVERLTAVGGMGYRQVGELPIATWFMAHFEAAALWSHTAEGAAEAICKAALKAMAGERVIRYRAAGGVRGQGGDERD